jgi:hypothetical protein
MVGLLLKQPQVLLTGELISQLAILAIRVYHLFAHFRPVQLFIIAISTFTVVTATAFVGISLHELNAIEIPIPTLSFAKVGCSAIPPTNLWRPFLPTITVHTILFLLTTIRALQSGRKLQPSLVMKRLLREYVDFEF